MIAALMAGPSFALFIFPNPVKKSTPLPTAADGEDLHVVTKRIMPLNLVDKHVKKSENGETFVPEKFLDKIKGTIRAVL
jgi:hypothetical protein